MRLDALMRDLTRTIAAAEIDNPRLEARLIAMTASGLGLEAMIAYPDTPIDPDTCAYAYALAEARVLGAPSAYLVGHKEFWSLDFKVSSATLVPRPDSETLVSAALEFAEGSDWAGRVLDLGTGSGCLLLAFLSERRLAYGTGIDASAEALEVAAANAVLLGLASRASFACANWSTALRGRFNLVFANPPYIRASDINGLGLEVRDFEPFEALDGGSDGLMCYRAILADLPRVMAPGARVFFEVGQGQAADVAALCAKAGLAPIGLYRDLAGIERCVVAEKNRLD
ncbi:MAG: peptide chain release factor N(5)-glutamine methyltransferase [Telmatospirillum sp.]|nr:peptide chain release factor N(5)-glutamine methyltransferase [Telmatospirillum sp.]